MKWQATWAVTGATGIVLSLASALAQEPQDAAAASLEQPGLQRSIRGDYGFVLTQACVRTPFQPAGARGIDPVTRRLLVAGEQFNAVGTGLLSFAADGTVRLEQGSLSELSNSMLGVGQAPVSTPTPFTCSGPFTVQSNKLALTLNCSVSNPPPGLKVSIGPLPFAGVLGKEHTSFTLNTVGNEVHKVTITSGETVVQERDRICLQSMQLDRLK